MEKEPQAIVLEVAEARGRLSWIFFTSTFTASVGPLVSRVACQPRICGPHRWTVRARRSSSGASAVSQWGVEPT